MLPESRLAHGKILARHGQLHASIDECVTAYELDPVAARIAAKVGDSYSRTGHADLAIRWYEKATRREVRPLYADILGDAWMDLGDFKKAEAAYKNTAVFRTDLSTAAAGFARWLCFGVATTKPTATESPTPSVSPTYTPPPSRTPIPSSTG